MLIQADTEQSLDKGVADYMECWNPAGYMTRVSERYQCPEGSRAVIQRLASCE